MSFFLDEALTGDFPFDGFDFDFGEVDLEMESWRSCEYLGVDVRVEALGSRGRGTREWSITSVMRGDIGTGKWPNVESYGIESNDSAILISSLGAFLIDEVCDPALFAFCRGVGPMIRADCIERDVCEGAIFDECIDTEADEIGDLSVHRTDRSEYDLPLRYSGANSFGLRSGK